MDRHLSTPLAPAARALGLLLLVAAVALVYARSLSGELVYDDLYLVAQNPEITSLAHLPRLFTQAYWDFLDAGTASHVGYYRPLSSVLLTIGWAIGGAEPWIYHLLSVLLHAAATAAAWLLVARLTGSERVGFFAALLFALHPLQVESVAWISAVNVPLFATFALLSLAAFVRWRGDGSRGLPWAAGLLLLPALLGKEAAVAVVPMALAIDLGRRRPDADGGGLRARFTPFVRAYAPFAAAGLLYYGLRVATFGDWRAGFDRVTTYFGVPAARLAMLRVELLGGAAKLIALPTDQNLFRAFVPALEPTGTGFLVPLAWTLALAAGVGLLWWQRRRPELGLLLLLPAALFPVLTRVQSLGTFPLSDRFLYLPLVGFTGLVSYALLARAPRPVAVGTLLAVAALYATRTVVRIGDWADERALFTRAVEQNPRNPSVHWGLGRVLLNEYRAQPDAVTLRRAQESYDRAMDLLEAARSDETIFAPVDDYRQANLGLGWTLLYEAQRDEYNDYETPRIVFERVTKSYPTYEGGFVGLGVAYTLLEKPDEAAAAFRKAIELNPRSVEAHHNFAALFIQLGDWENAEEHFREAMRYREGNLGDLVGLARALELQGEADEAWEVAREANRLHPQAADPPYLLGKMAFAAGRAAEALGWLDAALANNPAHGPAHLQHGMVLTALGQPKLAAKDYQRAAELMPGNFTASYNLGALLLQSDQPAAAIGPLVRAYELRADDALGKAVYDSLLALEPADPEVLHRLGLIDANRRALERALGWAERGMERDPDHVGCVFLAGLVHKEREEYDVALALLLRAAELAPENFRVRFETGALLAGLERSDEALRELRAALALVGTEPLPDEVRASLRGDIEAEIERLEGPGGTGG